MQKKLAPLVVRSFTYSAVNAGVFRGRAVRWQESEVDLSDGRERQTARVMDCGPGPENRSWGILRVHSAVLEGLRAVFEPSAPVCWLSGPVPILVEMSSRALPGTPVSENQAVPAAQRFVRPPGSGHWGAAVKGRLSSSKLHPVVGPHYTAGRFRDASER
jgi:hypothetical protein